MHYPQTDLLIGATWRPGRDNQFGAVRNPATGEAIAAAADGVAQWHLMSGFERTRSVAA